MKSTTTQRGLGQQLNSVKPTAPPASPGVSVVQATSSPNLPILWELEATLFTRARTLDEFSFRVMRFLEEGARLETGEAMPPVPDMSLAALTVESIENLNRAIDRLYLIANALGL